MKKFLFIDLETTGLTPNDHTILEFAMIITDHKLNELKSYSAVIRASDFMLQGMNHWCETTHKNSGLIDEVKLSGNTVQSVEKDVLNILAEQFTEPGRIVIAGNSVHFDKKFIEALMPNLNKRLHYRIVDVSSFMEAYKIYTGEEPERSNATAHRALPDIQDSIRYLKNYLGKLK